jgi:PAS domain S-box-containing protein
LEAIVNPGFLVAPSQWERRTAMLANVSLKVKLIGGFTLVAAIASVVGWVGYRGVGETGQIVEEIGAGRLPGVQSLLKIQAASARIKAIQRTLLDPDVNQEIRDRQMKNVVAARESYEAAWKVYETLPHSQEEGALWNALAPAWQAWRNDNNEFFRLIGELSRLNVGNPYRLAECMETARADHHRRLQQTLELIATKKDFDGGESHEHCNLGKWMAHFHAENPELVRSLDAIKRPHQEFHKALSQVKELTRKNDIEAATACYYKTMRPASEELLVQFEQMRNVADKALKLFADTQKQSYDACRVTEKKANEILDKLVEVNTAAAAGAVKQGTQAAAQARALALYVSIAGVAIALGLGICLALSISRPVTRVADALKAMADGDYSVRVHLASKDEIGRMADALNTTVAAVAKAMQDVKEAAERERLAQEARQEQERLAAEHMKRALEEAQLAAEKLNSIPAPVLTIDKEFNVTFMNRTGAGVLGHTPEECVGKKCYDLFKTPHCRTAECRVAQAMQRDMVLAAETVVDPARLNLPIQYTGAPIKDSAGQIIGAFEYAVDMTDTVKARQVTEKVAHYQKKEVGKLSALLQRVAAGDLTQQYNVGQADQDTAEVGRSFQTIGQAMNETITNLSQIIAQVTEGATQFNEGSRVIAESAQTLASGAQSQSSSVEEMTASIEELARSIEGVKESAQEADRIAHNANQLAEQGGTAVQKSIEAMDLIRTSSTQISEIIQVISEIASQTNLLALNAAIEAARAGEHGMGFAVVADEVRKLAERSNQAAREISTLIKESTQRVEEGAQLSEDTGKSLKQIVEGVEATAARIAEIAAATVQQAANADEVSKAIQGVAQVTEQAAAGSEEMASSSEELGAQASALQQIVSRFRTV